MKRKLTKAPIYTGLNLTPDEENAVDQLIAKAEELIRQRRLRVLQQLASEEKLMLANVKARMDRRRAEMRVS